MTLPAVVTSERLTLPVWTPDEAADIRAGRSREGWHRDYPRQDDRDAAGMYHRDDPWAPRHIVRGTTALGSIGFFGPPEAATDDVPEVEVGYGLVDEAHGYGFATEALTALLVETDAAGVRVRASVEPANKASVRVLVKCGFTELRGANEDGELVMARPLPGSPVVEVRARRAPRRASRPRLVATDLDGTLVRSDGSISPYTAQVLAAVEALGVPVVFVTGRPLRWTEVVFEHVGGHGLAVVSNGALVWDVAAHEPRLERPIEPEVALGVARELRAALPQLRFAVETVAGWSMEPDYARHEADAEHKFGALREAPLEELLEQPVLKLLARLDDADPDELVAAAAQVVGDRVNVTHSSFPLLEISAAAVTKASTLALLCADVGIDASEVIAFGDMPNDLQMLTWAGTSYAMADAHPSVVAAADHVAPGHDEDGVAQVLAGVFDLRSVE